MRNSPALSALLLDLCLRAQFGCIERLVPEVAQSQGVLVVDALTVSENAAYTISISRTLFVAAIPGAGSRKVGHCSCARQIEYCGRRLTNFGDQSSCCVNW